jgi:hypothetical protein
MHGSCLSNKYDACVHFSYLMMAGGSIITKDWGDSICYPSIASSTFLATTTTSYYCGGYYFRQASNNMILVAGNLFASSTQIFLSNSSQ